MRLHIIRITKRQLSICLATLFFATNLSSSENSYQTLSKEAIELAYNLHFEAATEIFDQLIKMEPDNPHAYLMQSVNLYYRYQLEENHHNLAKQFLQYSNAVIQAARKTIPSAEKKVDAFFYLGTIHMYLAAYYAWESQWLKSYWYGKEGIGFLEEVVKLDSSYYDAYLGLGLYHYYTDIIPKVAKAFTFLLGIESDRAKGLAELKTAAAKGTYSRAESLLFLGSIYLYLEKDYDKSLAYFEQLVAMYPENASFLMLLGETYQKLNRNQEAIHTLSQLIMEKSQPAYPALLVSSYFRLGNLYYNLRDLDKAIHHYRKSLEFAARSTGKVKWVNALANLNLGRSYDLLGKRDQALTHYNLVKKIDHKHAHKIAQKRIRKPLNQLADQSRNGSYDEIIELHQEEARKETLSSGVSLETQYQIAIDFFNKGTYAAAISKLHNIIDNTQESQLPWIKPWSYFYLANSYLKIGDKKKAQDALKLAAEYDDPELRNQINKLETNPASN